MGGNHRIFKGSDVNLPHPRPGRGDGAKKSSYKGKGFVSEEQKRNKSFLPENNNNMKKNKSKKSTIFVFRKTNEEQFGPGKEGGKGKWEKMEGRRDERIPYKSSFIGVT
jgi:hypothetical protein